MGLNFKWVFLLTLLLNNAIAYNKNYEEYYDFLQPFMVNIDENHTTDHTNIQKSLLKFQILAKVASNSKEFHYLNYKLMQEFQYRHFKISLDNINRNNNFNKEEQFYTSQKNYFMEILKSIKNPSFFTLYSKLYLETLKSKKLKDSTLIQLNSLANEKQSPYVQLLSYLDSLNQLNSISLKDQETLHKKLTLLLIGLPKKQEEYILRLTALQLSPLYEQNTLEFEFNKLFAKKSSISRKDVLKILNYKKAELFYNYIMREKRSFFETRVFDNIMKALKRNDVAMILTTLYLQNNQFDEARSYLRQAPRTNLYNRYNPFNSSIDIHNQHNPKSSSNQRKFADIMLRIEKKFEKKTATARDYYLYGNGLYNKSWFGNFPMSSVFLHSKVIKKEEPLPPTTNLEGASSAYYSALELAENEEFRAEIAYHLLKIEFNKALIDKEKYREHIKKMPQLHEKEKVTYLLKASRSFIETLHDYKSDYSETKYGQRVIKNSIIFSYL